MKITQYYDNSRIRVGLIEGNRLQPIAFDGDMIDFIECGKAPVPSGSPIALDQAALTAPVTRPSKIIALGLNYQDHAVEGKGAVPDHPLIFAKFPSSLIGHRETIRWNSSITKKVDFEAELAVVIGKRVFDISEDEAMAAVFGYMCSNDVSARDLQFGDKQWVRGKSLDTFCPVGPWISSRDEIADPHDLVIQSRLNGQIMQNSNTSQMFFKIPVIVSFMSRHFTLLPGDLILTGTPGGVGVFRTPRVYMKNGDLIEVEIQGLGCLSNRCETFET